MEFNTGGTADSSNSGAMTGGTMASSMYKRGGGIRKPFVITASGYVQVAKGDYLTIKKTDKPIIGIKLTLDELFQWQRNKATPEIEKKATDRRIIKEGEKVKIEAMLGTSNYGFEIYASTNDGYLIEEPKNQFVENSFGRGGLWKVEPSERYSNGGGLKPIPKGNKGLPKLPESVRNKMGYMAQGGGVGIDYNKFVKTKTAQYRKEGYSLIDAIDTAFIDLGVETKGKFEKRKLDKLIASSPNVKKGWTKYKKYSGVHLKDGYYFRPYQIEDEDDEDYYDKMQKVAIAHEKEAKKNKAEFYNYGWGSGEYYIHSKTSKGNLFTELGENGKITHEWDYAKGGGVGKMAQGGEVEDFDSNYWLQYNEKGSTNQAPDYFYKESKNFEDTFEEAIDEWNSEADGEDNKVKGQEVIYIKNTAKKFFEKEKWISINIIQAMIMQEAGTKFSKYAKGGGVGISDLVVGNDYAIVDFGMGYWLNDWTFKGKKGETYLFTSSKQFDDSEMVFTKEELLEYIKDGAIVENDNVDDFEEYTKYVKGGGTKKNITTKKTKTMDKKWSKKIDKAIKAKKPGFRKSPSGGYYEYRSNRSDVNPKMKLEWGGTAESSETGEPIGGENQSSMFSEGGNIGGFTYSIGGL